MSGVRVPEAPPNIFYPFIIKGLDGENEARHHFCTILLHRNGRRALLFKASKKAPYLYRHTKSASFYFRRSVPDDLRTLIGRREIKISLKTSDKSQAILFHNLFAANVERTFHDIRVGSNMNENELKKLIGNIQGFTVKSMKRHADGSVEIEGLEVDPSRAEEEKMLLQAAGIFPSSSPSSPSHQMQVQAGMRFSELEELYWSKTKRLTAKKEKEDRAIYRTFIELFDNPFLSEISHPMLTIFSEILEEYPTNAKKIYPNLTAKQISKLNHSRKTLSPKSINKYMNRVGVLFQFAINRGEMSVDFSKGKRVEEDTNAKDEREPFTDAEVNTLLRTVEDEKTNNPDLYWLMYIGAYTGMRIGEICQLQPEDILRDAGVLCFDINENHDLKSCKNSGSKRLIPIHDNLINLGFIDFVSSRFNQEFLFQFNYHLEQGWSYESSKETRYFIQEKCNIKKKSFHSFRHSVATKLMNKISPTITIELIKGVLGHAQDGQTLGRYGKGFKGPILKHVVDAIDFD
ncbi:site-specific integrase [Mariprofundus erugo]|uniref:Site-specific integrase n=1 Tax=Mariprofundus erugo TaxID=2528639 RepID=A0A5R9GKI7_9PROT|nr:site-specific integrase [Mariprofundus erugo]TLS66278.1 site-specific integrase [Mariprofundus erugo]